MAQCGQDAPGRRCQEGLDEAGAGVMHLCEVLKVRGGMDRTESKVNWEEFLRLF